MKHRLSLSGLGGGGRKQKKKKKSSLKIYAIGANSSEFMELVLKGFTRLVPRDLISSGLVGRNIVKWLSNLVPRVSLWERKKKLGPCVKYFLWKRHKYQTFFSFFF